MKRAFSLLLALALLLPLAACRKEPAGPTEPEPVRNLPSMEDFLANWACGVSNGAGENPDATHLAIINYAVGTDFSKLDLALGPFGRRKVTYLGEKESDGSGPREYPTYAAVAGPHFSFEEPAAAHAREFLVLVDSGALGDGLVPVAQQYDRESFAYPAAAAADVAIAEAARSGRRVIKSQLLGASEDGARICLFRYESLEEESLFTIAYMEGEDIFLPFDTSVADPLGYHPWWSAEPDNAGMMVLCRTREGVLLICMWVSPEGNTIGFGLREADGALEIANISSYVYDSWSAAFVLSEPVEDGEAGENGEIEKIEKIEKIEEKQP